MFEFLRNWIITVVVTVIFMILVDMILPSNNLKKYAKLVTGLIIIVTILSPVFKLFDRNSNIQGTISQYMNSFNDTMLADKKDYENNFTSQTIEVFKQKLKEKIEQGIFDNLGEKYSVASLEVNEKTNDLDYLGIKHLVLKKNSASKTIEPVSKIEIGRKDNKNEYIWDQKVAKVLKDKLDIDPSTIKFVK